MKTIERIKSNLNPSLEIRGILLTMYDKRNKLSGQVEIEARNYFKEKVYLTPVPRNVKIIRSTFSWSTRSYYMTSFVLAVKHILNLHKNF